MKDNRNFREIQAALRWAGIESRKVRGYERLRVQVPIEGRKYSLTVGTDGYRWSTELDQPQNQLDEDSQVVHEEFAAFRYRVQIAIDSSRMDEGESPAIESSAAENEESNPTECQSPEALQGEGLGGDEAAAPEAPGEDAITPGEKPCPECEGTGMCQGDLQAFNEGKEGCPCWDEEGITEGGETLGEGCPDDGVCWKCDGSGFVAANEEAPGEESEIDRELRAFAGEMKAFRQSFEDALAGDGEAPGEDAIASIEEKDADAIAPDPIEEIKEKVSLTERICVKCVQLGIEVAGACRLATGKSLLQCSVAELNLFLKRITGLAEWIGGIDDPIPDEELDEGEKAANDYGQQFIARFLRGEQVDEEAIASLPDQYEGEECPECKGKGHLSQTEYWDEECQTSLPEDDEAWCRKCYGSGIFPPPQRLAATVEACLFRRAQKVANELGFQYLARENKHMIIRENFIEAYSTAEGAIEGMREAILVDTEKHLLKTAIDSLCYEMAMSKLPANNICVSVTGNTIEACSVDDLKIFLNHLRYIEKVALGSHQDNRHTS